ncbi:MAG TPA: prolyl oligopeptidase family serine peptidase [Gemmatimonadaceae bacterium]|nr:prolyl oligopeptidase family serine peptidase [Gemmatimonadaceae bacterium]
MPVSRPRHTRAIQSATSFTVALACVSSAAVAQSGDGKRPMTFLDQQNMRQVGSPSPSPDRKSLLYTISIPDWNQARRQTDIYVVSMDQGVSSTRQLTYTKDKSEAQPTWAPDGSFFVFSSNRDAAPTPGGAGGAAAAAEPQGGGGFGGGGGGAGFQLYMMHPDGGEARKITDAREGVTTFAFSKDGKWLVYRSGKAGEEQLYRVPVADLDNDAKAEQITRHPTGVGIWRFAPTGGRIYFITADTIDLDEKLRREKRFTVNIRNPESPISSLWAFDLDAKKTTRLTKDTSITVTDFNASPDGKYVAFRGISSNRYKRNVTEQSINGDDFLLDVGSGAIERLTNNAEVGESTPSFSPDSKWIAFSAPNDLTKFSMSNNRVYLRAVADKGGPWRKLGTDFDGDVTVGFWSRDGKTIYFNEGVRATNQVLTLDVATGKVTQLTNEKATVSANYDEDTKAILINYSDPMTPTTLFAVSSPEQIGNRGSWKQLTDANPWVKSVALGQEEEITWKSSDGRTVGGILVKPVGYKPGQRYPLIVAIHGGPAAADMLGFNGGYGAQTYAGAGYAVLKPNYRGSTNYGEKHKTDIVGDYFRLGYDDIMTGVNTLIAQGVVDSTKMGVLGWSAGGHWSNWILTHTNRFKAISTGAGTTNWISMYAQSDMQRNRQYYLGNKLPYDNFDAYWNQSPIKYIKNAKTPTMIHVVHDDPRVPRPQSEELFMALRQLGVPTEFYVYPGASHGIPDPRNQLVKSAAEMAWMDYYVRGSGKKFAWRDVLKTLEDPNNPRNPETRAVIQEQ